MTAEEWEQVRAVWEADEREGYAWVKRELELSVSLPAVRKQAIKGEWTKKGNQKPKAQKPETEKPETKNQKPARKKRGTKLGANPDAPPGLKRMATKSKGPVNISEYLDDDWDDPEKMEKGAGSAIFRDTCTPMRDPGLNDFEYGGLKQLLGRKPGSSTNYREEYAIITLRFLMLGGTIEDVAELIGVSPATIYNWAKDQPELAAAINGGRNFADANIASRLYQRAMGYTHETEEIKVVGDEIHRVPVVKHYPPDANSLKFWLINRQPDLWKEKVEVIEKPVITMIDKDHMDKIYSEALQQAEDKRNALQGRADRLGLVLDSEVISDGEIVLDDAWGDD